MHQTCDMEFTMKLCRSIKISSEFCKFHFNSYINAITHVTYAYRKVRKLSKILWEMSLVLYDQKLYVIQRVSYIKCIFDMLSVLLKIIKILIFFT